MCATSCWWSQSTSFLLNAVKECRADPSLPCSSHFMSTHTCTRSPHSQRSAATRGDNCPSRWLCSRGCDGEDTVVKWQLKSTLSSLCPHPLKRTHTHTHGHPPPEVSHTFSCQPPLGGFSSFDPVFPLVSARSLTQSISTTRSQSWISPCQLCVCVCV